MKPGGIRVLALVQNFDSAALSLLFHHSSLCQPHSPMHSALCTPQHKLPPLSARALCSVHTALVPQLLDDAVGLAVAVVQCSITLLI
jgi:hypothetical protein